MKTNNLKKIISIIIISLVLAIMVTTIVLACITKAQADPITNRDFTLVTVYNNDKSNMWNYANPQSEEAENITKKIMSLHEESLKSNLLSSIFQGTSSFEPKVEKYGITNLVGNIAKVDGKICLVFTFLQEQKLIINGEEYTYETTTSSTPVTYKKIFMPVTNNKSFEECTIYLADADNKSSFQVTFLAHQSELYNYLSTLELHV